MALPDPQTVQEMVATAMMVVTTAVWPPVFTGAFWTLLGVYGVISILFDDETPRGNPGIDYARRSVRDLYKTNPDT